MTPRIFTRGAVAYALYDFANSAFATTILSVVFNVYFVQVICAGGVPALGRLVPGAALWGYAVSASTLTIFFLAPILGAAADRSLLKKKFLAFFTASGCIATALLSSCAEGDAWRAVFLFGMANLCFNACTVFYNSLLEEVSTPQTVGRVSGFGWALGYIGGGLLLALNLLVIQHPSWFHVPIVAHGPVRAAIFSVALWWGLFSLPLFHWVPETVVPRAANPGQNLVAAAFSDVRTTFREIRKHKEMFKFLVANMVYNDGIETVIVMASIFGASALGMNQGELILCFLMIQAVAFLGALGFGHLADRSGHKRAVSLTLWIYLAVCAAGALIQTKAHFWILGAVIGVILGGSQAASRSLLARMVPEKNSAQFFGFFALTGKLAAAAGPLLFGVVSQVWSLRAAVGSLSVFFALGLFLLHFVREPDPA